MESPTSEFYKVVPETESVKAVMEVVKRNWGDEYFTLHHNSIKMESDKLLSAYNVRDGSIIKVMYFAEFP
ncbi:hypothetical protein C2S53_017004 [Perilla frutescens var. hirtella]|uniref:Ubiquitin-like domain-containing protein n=1 Tax=Perilla frutescens var. hirtella TaxID=608512 RepID=A0AAD4JHS1_PERFH|nr:hypothetical protein C2S53_017004 [Perilla frutescens var. hirtella]